MFATSAMLSVLDDAMREHQIVADGDLDPLFHPEVPPAQYLLYLTRIYGFIAPLECALEMTPGLDRMIDLRGRTKSQHIVSDLLSLGLRPAALAEMPLCLTVPQFRGAAEALGWMYVMERQTLVHGVMHRHLDAILPQQAATATAFLRNYDGTTGQRWRELGSTIDEVAAPSYAIADRIVAAANEGYRCLHRWIGHETAPTRHLVAS
jgi:heme oxygenase (biliverdin-IX-beta and delta-forming)